MKALVGLYAVHISFLVGSHLRASTELAILFKGIDSFRLLPLYHLLPTYLRNDIPIYLSSCIGLFSASLLPSTQDQLQLMPFRTCFAWFGLYLEFCIWFGSYPIFCIWFGSYLIFCIWYLVWSIPDFGFLFCDKCCQVWFGLVLSVYRLYFLLCILYLLYNETQLLRARF